MSGSLKGGGNGHDLVVLEPIDANNTRDRVNDDHVPLVSKPFDLCPVD